MVPIDVATKATVSFIADSISSPTTLLEIGCGNGDVALALVDLDYEVTGLDTDEDSVFGARKRGAPVILAEWPDFICEPVDAIVFTRSLHHIHDLDAAMDRAKELLKPDGKLLVEDFAFNETDATTIDWFMQVINTPEACDLIVPTPDEFVTNLLAAADPETAWHEKHDHELHTIGAMKKAVAERFAIENYLSTPYLYRYLIPVLPETGEAASFVERVFQDEMRAGETGDISLVGRRIGATQV